MRLWVQNPQGAYLNYHIKQKFSLSLSLCKDGVEASNQLGDDEVSGSRNRTCQELQGDENDTVLIKKKRTRLKKQSR